LLHALSATRNSSTGPAQPGIDQCVVLVDDSAAVRESTRLLLKTVGLEVLAYRSPADFLEELPMASCVLLDIRMPEMSGIEVYRRLREAGVGTPVIFMTGHGQVSMAVGAMRDGAFDFLEKPVDDQRLIDVVFSAIASDKQRRDAAGSRELLAEKLARLTDRERGVADMIAQGYSSREVAEQLSLSVRTVEGHRSRILAKLEAGSLAQMIHMLSDAQK
jgi:FixJ family two-component response regulator